MDMSQLEGPQKSASNLFGLLEHPKVKPRLPWYDTGRDRLLEDPSSTVLYNLNPDCESCCLKGDDRAFARDLYRRLGSPRLRNILHLPAPMDMENDTIWFWNYYILHYYWVFNCHDSAAGPCAPVDPSLGLQILTAGHHLVEEGLSRLLLVCGLVYHEARRSEYAPRTKVIFLPPPDFALCFKDVTVEYKLKYFRPHSYRLLTGKEPDFLRASLSFYAFQLCRLYQEGRDVLFQDFQFQPIEGLSSSLNSVLRSWLGQGGLSDFVSFRQARLAWLEAMTERQADAFLA